MTDQATPQHPFARGLALLSLWEAPAASRPGPRPRLSLSEIVDAAVALARAEGLSAVTMARVAQDVGCAKMALYRHVSGHRDLLSAMLDDALGDPPEVAGSWREQFLALWEALLGVYARDPWLLELPSDTPGLTPRNVAWVDTALSLFAGSTLPIDERLNTVLLITENIRFEARRRPAGSEAVDDLDHLFSSAWQAGGQLPAEQFPHLAHLAAVAASSPRAHGGSAASTEQVRELLLRSIAVYFPDERAR